ncbi:unnamed protein product [Mycena citricolor]|uniref:Glycosyl hydrolase family 30 TIM-barrel domain-containing protein n=1 Tax=Mycena citricolor TaxID=2018698 RepID=A0AAD2K075_9AGAR|nr:unnamed protein product [Mycena citricolor]
MRTLYLAVLIQPILSQQIWDVWQTTWDQSKLFSSLAPSQPINFANVTIRSAAQIAVDDTATYQSVWGVGGSLTDSSALVLSNLKVQNPANYRALLNYVFSPTDGANSAGLSYIRVPLGASDFSAKRRAAMSHHILNLTWLSVWSFDDAAGDTSLNSFSASRAPSYLYSVIRDIQAVNPLLKVHLVPWSPPGWMKTSGTMNGGSLQYQYISTYAKYLLKCLQAFEAQGVTSLYAISVQNEPQNSQSSYPTTAMSVTVHAQIGIALRTLMNNNGFAQVKLIGYEHNWDSAGSYPIQLMKAAPHAFDGVAFHCYAGTVGQQDTFHAAYPAKEIYFTECAGTIGSDWWSDVKWYMDNIFLGAITHNAHSALMWNIALDDGLPKLPGTTSCGGPGCRSIVQVNSDGTYSFNQEFYAMAQLSKAILPKDVNGPWAKRIGVTVGGDQGWALVVNAFVTGRAGPGDWLRYSLVVMNCNDNSDGWNPTPVKTAIEFRGMQATFTFPVGVTTLWWYAPPGGAGYNATEIVAESDDGQQRVFS